MQKSGNDRLLIHFQICQDDGNAKRMDDIRLARLTALPLMRCIGNVICLFDHGNVRVRVILTDALDQFTMQFFRLNKIRSGDNALAFPVDTLFHLF